jgi:uncharacterized iron-regulated membrane protein
MKRILRAALRAIFLTHRYVGIVLGVLMAVWCLSGVVMMYQPYPGLSETERRAGMAPIPAIAIQSPPAEVLADDVSAAQVSVEMMGETPVARVGRGFGAPRLVDLKSGRIIDMVGEAEARAVAESWGARNGLGAPKAEGLVEVDQWTLNRPPSDRPAYKFAFPDKARTEFYVAQSSGRAIQRTTATARFWNWMGAIPHWLYFTALRQDGQLWTRVVVWSSVVGCFLTLTGLYLGIVQLRRRKSTGKLASPYKGFMWWHHIPGLVFGLFALTWVFSGLMSMEPFGWLPGGSAPSEARARLTGEAPSWGEVRQALPKMLARLPAGTVSLQSAWTDGKVYAAATTADGRRVRLDAQGAPAPLGKADYDKAAATLSLDGGPARWSLMTRHDAYYYGTVHTPAPLPVVRVDAAAKDTAVFYLDPVTGRVLDYHDRDGRLRRWLHNGLHSLDFTAWLRMRPVWDLIMLPLLLGASLVCATGAWLGLMRLIRRPMSRAAPES